MMNFTKSYTGLEAQLMCVYMYFYLLKTSLYHREFRYLNNEGIAQEDSIYRVMVVNWRVFVLSYFETSSCIIIIWE